MVRCVKSFVFITLLFSLPIFADSISVGYLQNLADSPNNGEQTITISNDTGACVGNSPYDSCTNLTFTDWTLTVNYTSDYYNASGPAEPAPFVYTDFGAGPYGGWGDILAQSSLSFSFDLCAGLGSCLNPDSPDTQITSVEFAGQITPSSFCLSPDNSCDTFTADPNFDLVWDGSSPVGPYVDEGNFQFAQSPDITVNAAEVVSSSTPEPNTFLLLTALLPIAWFVRRPKSAKTSL